MRFIWAIVMIVFALFVSACAEGFYSQPGIAVPFIIAVCLIILISSGAMMVFTTITIDEEGIRSRSLLGEKRFSWDEIYEAGAFARNKYGGRSLRLDELAPLTFSKYVYVSNYSIDKPWSILDRERMIFFYFDRRAFELLRSRIDHSRWKLAR